MGKSSIIFKRLLAAALTVFLVMALLPWTALAAPVIDEGAEGSLSIELKYGGSYLSGGVFDLYYVAGLDSGPVLHYDLIHPFAGVDLNAVKTSSELESAAAELAKQISEAVKVTTLKTAGAPAKADDLALGVYLVVQTASPASYSKAAPFLVFVPMTNGAGTDWVYELTAAPKVRYNPPDNSVSVSVVKEWDDPGFEDERPLRVLAGLYRNGQLHDTQTLSAANNWRYVWYGLSPSSAWTVEELEIPEHYACLVSNTGNNWTLTNIREDVPLGAALNVTKEWIGDSAATRPESISVSLLRDGEVYETVALTAQNGWRYAWPALSADHTWTIRENDVPEGYSSSIENVPGGFLLKNTYDTTEIPDDDTPLAPQTGLLQWPVPVLLSAGSLLIAAGAAARRAKKKKTDA